MIHSLSDRLELPPGGSGRAGEELTQLARAGVPVADTIVCPSGLFTSFREQGRVAPAVVSCLLGLMEGGDFAVHPRCFVRSSTARPYSGLIADVQAEKNATALKHALERVYRSWSSDRARAARIAHQVGDADGAPAILIQPCYDRVETLLSRVPDTGAATQSDNVLGSPQNTVVPFLPEHAALLAQVDTLFRRPCKVLLPAGPPLRILAVKEQPITPAGALACACEYLRAGLIDGAEFLLRVSPSSYLGAMGEQVVAADEGAFRARGIGAVEGMASGRFYLSADRAEQAAGLRPGEGIILVGREVSPEDIRGIHTASGVLMLFGGASSHAALACRSLGKVCVVGCSELSIDDAKRCVRAASGASMKEGAYVLVNGQTGEVIFSERPLTLRQTVEVRAEARGALDIVQEVLAQFEEPKAFRELPAPVQARVGLHNQYLRELGLKR